MISALAVWVGAIVIAFLVTVGSPTPEPVAVEQVDTHSRHLHSLTTTIDDIVAQPTTTKHCEAANSCCSCK
jgi:hypothetical protein